MPVKGTKSKSKFVNGGIIRLRGQRFLAEVNKDYKRQRKTFDTEDEAEEWIKNKRKQIKEQGNLALKLTEREIIDAAEALTRLDGSASLTEATAFYLHHHKPDGGTKTVQQLYDEYLDGKKRAGRRPITIRDIRHQLGRFVKVYSERGVHTITTNDIESWVNKANGSGITRWNAIRAVKAFFKYAQKKHLVQNNPAEPIEKPSIDEKMPEFLAVKDVEKLFAKAEEMNPIIAVVFAIQYFSGLRTAEVQQLQWKHVDLEQRLIRVQPETAKKRRSRLVNISDNLAAWLVKYGKSDGDVCLKEATYRRQSKLIRTRAGIHYPNNGARHSFATYHLAQHEDAAKTSLQLGHRDTAVLYDHYRGLATKADAKKYWSIRPKKKGADKEDG